MARRTPYVVDGALHIPGLPGEPGIRVDSASWAAWLTGTRAVARARELRLLTR